jgi:hypothetical protein
VGVEHRVEEMQPVVVEAPGENARVVELRPGHPLEAPRPGLRCVVLGVALASLLEDDLPRRDPARRVQVRASVYGLQRSDHFGQVMTEEHVVVPFVLRLPAALRHRSVPDAEELDRAPLAHEVGKALVEGDATRDEERVVRQLVDDGRDQRYVLVAQHGGQQRVVEPAERAEGADRPHVHVKAAALEAVGRGERAVGVEEALVGHAPDDREPPRDRLEPVAVRRRQHEAERVPVHPRVGRVAVAGVEAQHVIGEGARLQHQLELAPHFRRGLRVRDHVDDRSPPVQDLRLFVARAQYVEGRAARRHGGGAEQQREQRGPAAWRHGLQRLQSSGAAPGECAHR